MSATTVEQRVVSMQFDNKHFEKNVQTSLSTIDKLKQSLNFKQASQGLDDFHNSTKNTLRKSQSEFESYRSGIFRIGDAINKMWSSMEYSVAGWLERTAKSLTVEPVTLGFNEYELKMGSIQTIMASTGESLETVNSYLGELNEYSDKTIYSFQDMTSNIGKFTNAGVNLKDSVAAIKGISNVAALSGANANEASRAMYNFSQALSSGYVKLIDWKSIENANMATVEFKNQLLETAAAQGILSKSSDGTYKTLKGTTISATKNFNDSLQEQWMTSEVLTKTLSKYADETTEIGKKATKAATEIKTFTQLFDTLKESAQSGWAQTWEILIGDFEEAKSFMTELSDVVGGLLDSSAKARNGLLSDWKTLGGRTDLLESIRNVFQGIGNVVGPIKEAFTNMFPPLTAKQLVGFTRGLRNLTNTFKEFGAKHGNNIRRTFEGIFAVLSVGWEIIKGVAGAVGDLLGGTDDLLGGVLSITAVVGDFLVLVSELIKRTGLFKAIFRAIGATFKVVVGFLSEIFKGIGKAFNLTPLEAFENFVMGISGRLNNFADSMGKVGEGIGSTFKNVLGAIADMPIVKFLSKAFGAVFKFIKKIGAAIGSFVNNSIDQLGESSFGDLLEFINNLLKVGIGAGLLDLIGNLNELFTGAGNLKDVISNLVNGFADVIDPLVDCFKSLQQQIKANVIRTIANSLLTLAVALVVIALIPKDKLYDSLAAIMVLFGGLMLAMNTFTKGLNGFMGGFKNFTESWKSIQSTFKMAGMITKIASAILILAVALKILSTMSWDEIERGLVAMAGCFVALLFALSIMSKIPESGTMASKGAAQLTKLSLALLIAIIPLKILGNMKWETIETGLKAMAGVLGMLSLTQVILNNFGSKSAKGAASAVILATTLLIVTTPLIALSALNPGALLRGIFGVTAILTALTATLAVLSKISSTKKMATKGATQLVIIAAALLLATQPFILLSALNWDALLRGVFGVTAILTALTGTLAVLSKISSTKKMASKGATQLVIIASVLLLATQPFMLLSALDWGALLRGIIGVTAVLGALVGTLALLSVISSTKKMATKGATQLVIIAAALLLATTPLLAISALNWEALGRGIAGIVGVLGILVIAQTLLSKFGSGSVKGAAGILILASSLSVLAIGLTLLGLVPITSIVTGLATLLVVLTLMSITVAALGPMVTGLLALGQGFAMMGLGLLAISAAALILGPALVGISAGLMALMTALSYVASMASVVADALVVLIAAAVEGLIKGITEAIVGILDLIVQAAPGIAKALIAIIFAVLDLLVEVVPALAEFIMKLLVSVVKYVAENIQPLVEALMELITGVIKGIANRIGPLIQAVVDLLFKFIQGVIDALANMKTADGLMDALETCSILTLIVAELAAVAALTPFAVVGVLGLGTVIGELVAVLSLIGGLARIPGIEWIMNEGGTFLKTVGNILNNTMGTLVTGFAQLALIAPLVPLAAIGAAGIGLIGTELVAALSVLGGISTLPGINWLMDKGGEFLSKLGNIIGNFVGSIIGGIGEGISSSLPAIGTNLSSFMENVSGFVNGARNIDESFVTGIDNLVSAMLKITGANVLDSLATFLTGESSLKDFAGELKTLGTGMADFAKTMTGVDMSLVEKGANAAKTLAEMTSIIPNTGGVVAWFSGENSIVNFAGDLKDLGAGIVNFANAISGADLSKVEAGANAGKTIAAMTEVIPKEGGVAAWFSGEQSIAKFAYQLPTLGKGIAGFATAIGDADVSKISSAVTAGKALAEMTSVIPTEGGIKAWFSGQNSITKFAGELPKLGEGLAGFGTKVANISPEKISAAAGAAKSLGDMTSVIPTNTNKIKTFGDNLVGFGTDLNSFMEKVKGISADSTSNVSEAVKVIETIAQIDSNNIKTVAKAIDTFTKSVSDMAKDIKSDLKDAGKEAIEAFIKGINDKLDAAKKACKAILDACVDALEGKSADFETAGKQVVQGFANGISKNTYMAEAKAAAMAKAAKQAAEDALGIQSPSKELYKDGRYTVLGFANGISDYANMAYGAGYNVAETAKDGFSKAISKISSIVDADMELQPTVRPVLDLSEIRNGASSINDLFGNGASVGVMSNVNSISTMMRGFNQNGANLEVVSAIDKLRKDLGNVGNTTYNVNGITYDDGSNISEAVQSLMRAARVERRI